MRIDFFSGHAKAPNHIGVDIVKEADIVLNLDDPNLELPFDSNSIDGARAHQGIEHIHNGIAFFNEVYRVLIKGAELELSTPLAGTPQFWQDPTHVKGYVIESFQYFVKDSPFQKEKDEYGITANFELVRGAIIDGWNLEVVLRK